MICDMLKYMPVVMSAIKIPRHFTMFSWLTDFCVCVVMFVCIPSSNVVSLLEGNDLFAVVVCVFFVVNLLLQNTNK